MGSADSSPPRRLVFVLGTASRDLANVVRESASGCDAGLRLVETVPELLRAVALSRPDACLIDASLGGGMSAREAVFALKENRPNEDLPIVLLLDPRDPESEALFDLASAVPGVDAWHWTSARNLQLRLAWLARHCHLRQRNATLEQTVDRLMTTDLTTGVFNHEETLRLLASQCRVAERYGRRLSVIYADLDYLGLLNEQHGFEAGDQALRAFAEAAVSMCRAADIVGRLGGADFLVVCPETDLDGASTLAERLRSACTEAIAKRVERSSVPVTATLACAEKDKTEDEHALLARVGKALRAAKKTARNRVVRAAPAGRSETTVGPPAV